MTIMNQVSDSPELLPQILVSLLDVKFLTAATRVNRTWHEIATQLLWVEPPVEALARVRKSRRQAYASNIRILGFVDRSLDCRVELMSLKGLGRIYSSGPLVIRAILAISYLGIDL